MPAYVHHRPASRARRWVCAAIAVCIVPATPAGAAPGDSGDPVECEKTTEILYAKRLYDDAAALALVCWDDTEVPLFLFRAAKYWKRAGRHAHAVHALKAYIRAAAHDDPKRIGDAKAVLRDERKHTGQVVVGLVPPLERDERLTITAAPRAGGAAPPLTTTFAAEEFVEVDLDPGAWDLSVVREGFKDKDKTVTVPPDRTPQTVRVDMEKNEPPPEEEPPPVVKEEPKPPPPPPPPAPSNALKLGGGVAVGGGTLLLALAIGYAASVSSAERKYIEVCERERDEAGCYQSYQYGKGLNVIQSVGFTAGAMLLGAGIAMLAIAARRKRGKAPQGLSLFRTHGGVGISLERRF